MRRLSEGLRWAGLWGSWRLPGRAGIFRARGRLGVEPMAALFARCARPLGTEAMPGVFFNGWRLMAIDGTRLDVADSEANAAAFGRPAPAVVTGTAVIRRRGSSRWWSAAPPLSSTRCSVAGMTARSAWPRTFSAH
ncbi:hypothetical protein GCM10010493_80420 [Streptomyces lavendulae subsp. grasserius]